MQKILKSFLLGIIAALAALVLEVIFALSFPQNVYAFDYFEKFTWLLLLVAIIEETIKTLSLSKLLKMNQGKWISSIFLGAGFGLTEIFLNNFLKNISFSPELFGILIIHILTCLVIGQILFSKMASIKSKIIISIILGSLIHLSYNLFIIYLT